MIYVICCDDSLEEASLNKEKAEKRLSKLALKHWKETVKNYGSNQSYEEYRKQVYWHIHTVKEVILA